MLDTLAMLFSYAFMQRALFVGILVAPCAALLGISLVLKRYSMIGDGLSHVGFGAMSVALALGIAPLKIAVPVVILAAFLLLRLSEKSKIGGDAAIALVSTGSIAAGVVVTSLVKGMSTDIYDLMFGSILSMTTEDVYFSIGLSIIVLFLYIILYRKIFAITFDESFAQSCGINTALYTMIIALLTAVTIVIGMRIMGTMLISSLIIFPTLTAMQVCKSFRSVTIWAVIISVLSFAIGLILSFLLSLPAGASIVLINIVFFSIFFLIGKLK
ncbi:MAG: metal ABC transporter permease [Clostridia bacterium]|nr:metal ABC transporter permease [Clostridia bacterium]